MKVILLVMTLSLIAMGFFITAPAPSESAQDAWESVQIQPGRTELGEFKITVYTPYDDNARWGYQTAMGVRSEHLKTCAVDPKVIPLGTRLNVGGIIMTAVDVGSGVKGKQIDVFYNGTIAESVRWLINWGEVKSVSTIPYTGTNTQILKGE